MLVRVDGLAVEFIGYEQGVAVCSVYILADVDIDRNRLHSKFEWVGPYLHDRHVHQYLSLHAMREHFSAHFGIALLFPTGTLA